MVKAVFDLNGKVDHFDKTIESRKSYVGRFEHYFTVNEIDLGKNVPSLLCLIGERMYSLSWDSTFPDKQADKNDQELVTVLNSHLFP